MKSFKLSDIHYSVDASRSPFSTLNFCSKVKRPVLNSLERVDVHFNLLYLVNVNRQPFQEQEFPQTVDVIEIIDIRLVTNIE